MNKLIISLLLLAAGIAGYTTWSLMQKSPTEIPGDNFAFIFKYGVGAKNELNTYNGTFTKDMIVDPPITIQLSLSEEELKSIHGYIAKMSVLGFLDYPSNYNYPTSGTVVTPYSTYYLKATANGFMKEIQWEDRNLSNETPFRELRGLAEYIQDIITNKPEYKKLPEPKGGYL